jgi:hypothetical protein
MSNNVCFTGQQDLMLKNISRYQRAVRREAGAAAADSLDIIPPTFVLPQVSWSDAHFAVWVGGNKACASKWCNEFCAFVCVCKCACAQAALTLACSNLWLGGQSTRYSCHTRNAEQRTAKAVGTVRTTRRACRHVEDVREVLQA